MGLYDYLLIIRVEKTVSNENLEKFFINNRFRIVDKTIKQTSLLYQSNFGEMEVLIDNEIEFSLKTKIQNEEGIIEEIILILKELIKENESEIVIYDFQHKKRLNSTNLQTLKEFYQKRRNELKQYF